MRFPKRCCYGYQCFAPDEGEKPRCGLKSEVLGDCGDFSSKSLFVVVCPFHLLHEGGEAKVKGTFQSANFCFCELIEKCDNDSDCCEGLHCSLKKHCMDEPIPP